LSDGPCSEGRSLMSIWGADNRLEATEAFRETSAGESERYGVPAIDIRLWEDRSDWVG